MGQVVFLLAAMFSLAAETVLAGDLFRAIPDLRPLFLAPGNSPTCSQSESREPASCVLARFLNDASSESNPRHPSGPRLLILKTEAERSAQRIKRIERDRLVDQVTEAINRCEQDRMDRCFPKLSATIPAASLDVLFKGWTQDPLYRMNTPEVQCHSRAYALAHELSRMGFKSKLVRIEDAPTLIAVDRGRNGKLKGRFNDYHGWHFAVMVEAESPDGSKQSRVLDPQFMDRPVSQDEYFVRTIGQRCKLIDSSVRKRISDADWDCTYRLLQPNYWYRAGDIKQEEFPFHPPIDPDAGCGWSILGQMKEEIRSINANYKGSSSDRIPQALRSERNPSVALILRAYKAKVAEARAENARLNEQARNLPAGETPESYVLMSFDSENGEKLTLASELKRTQGLIDSYDATVEQVKKNLSLLSR